MAEKVIPVVKAEEAEEEELVDPQQTLRVKKFNVSNVGIEDFVTEKMLGKCKKSEDDCSQKQDAQNQWGKYQECNNRVNSRSNTAETCEEELIDYVHILDKCVNKDLFKRLK